MSERAGRRSGYRLTVSDRLLHSEPMQQACAQRDFGEVFRLVNRRAGASYADIAAAVGKMTSARVGDVIRGVRRIRDVSVIERVADGLGIPGHMLGIDTRAWELPQRDLGNLNSVAIAPDESVSLGEALTAADEARQLMNRALASRTVTPEHIDALERAAARDARDSVFTAPLDMLNTLLFDFSEIRQFITEAQSPDVQGRLYRVTAQLAALAADELMVIGDARQAWAWHTTARSAADATGQPETMAQVRAVGTLIPLYYNNSSEAAVLAREVQEITDDARRSSAASALAATLESLALAQVDDLPGSVAALNRAEGEFERLDADQQAESVFGFSERRWAFYRARIISRQGDFERAWEAHEHALTLYPEQVVGDPSIIRLGQAESLIRHGGVEDGCNLAAETLLNMPAPHRTDIFLSQGGKVLNAVNPDQRFLPIARDLRDLVTRLRRSHAGKES
ncbi:hypothetical protein [Streptomyces synnematoformans]|uniref:XRE family transcriptional regulator n=1 Tax=Streptomyces synnematoformans TaxID=415721 RepID=A0ABN2Z2T3_9ACTN